MAIAIYHFRRATTTPPVNTKRAPRPGWAATSTSRGQSKSRQRRDERRPRNATATPPPPCKGGTSPPNAPSPEGRNPASQRQSRRAGAICTAPHVRRADRPGTIAACESTVIRINDSRSSEFPGPPGPPPPPLVPARPARYDADRWRLSPWDESNPAQTVSCPLCSLHPPLFT